MVVFRSSVKHYLLISTVMREEGVVGSHLKTKISKATAELYHEKFGKIPWQHLEKVNGTKMVNTYYEMDRDIVVHAITLVQAIEACA